MGDDELVHIEVLDDVSKAISAAQAKLSGARALQRSSSTRVGLSLDDIPDEELPHQGMRSLLESLRTLVETLFATKVFLKHSPSLQSCVQMLSGIDGEDQIRQMRSLVNLMIQTIHNHNIHECTELRYATLLEIILSHNSDWKPSENLNALWAELDLHVEDDCDCQGFRRVAYTVLISLPWMPPSCELYAACSYEESESMYPDLPDILRSKLDEEICDKPLLRCDRVYQILEEIGAEENEQEPFTVVISYDSDDGASTDSNGEGMGKTTLAALLAAHPAIAEHYSTFWVDLTLGEDDDSLSHDHYMECLQSLCQQLGVDPNWPQQVPRLEDEELRNRRQQEHMVLSKQSMAKLFENSGKRVLIVLDGALDEEDFEWFQLLDAQSSIVISKSSYIERATYTVEMEGLGEDEAISLFTSEASQDPDHPVFQTVEAKTLMNQCLFHPLIIRTVARWCKLKQITSGLAKGLEELNLRLSVLKHNAAKEQVPTVLAEVMNMMLSPSQRLSSDPSKILKLCLASVAVLFARESVPLDTVLILWSQVLGTNPYASAEIGENVELEELHKRVWFISESFMHLGIFSRTEENGVVLVKLHHPLYLNYGLSTIAEVQPPGYSLEETKGRWHKCFVDGYNARLKVLNSMPDLEDSCRAYFLEKVTTHMMEAKQIPKMIEMLKDERFCRERLKIFGWTKGSQCHIKDCILLKQRAIESKSASLSETRKVILSCLKKLASILCEETLNLPDSLRVEKAMALHLVGFNQADNGGISEALTQYKYALQIMPNPGHPFNAAIMYGQAVLQLLRNDHDKAFKKIKNCLKVLKDSDSLENNKVSLDLHPELLQLRGDAQAAACDYMGAETSYEEALEKVGAAFKIETGTALYRRGRHHQIMGELGQALSALTECIKWKRNIGENHTMNLVAAYSAAGDMHLALGEDKKALHTYESAFEILEEMKEEANEADRYILNGKVCHLKEDEESCKSALNAARELILKSPRILMDQSAYDLCCMGKIFRERGEDKLAAEIFEEGLELTKDRPESLERACILYEIGFCLLGFGNKKDTVACFEEALKIRKNKLGDCELVLDTQITLGQIFRKLTMHRECLGVSKDVMFLTEKLYRGDARKAAGALLGVAESYEILKEYSKAVAMFEECKELLKRSLRGNHPEIADVLQRLAKLHEDHKDFDKAYGCCSEALEICKANSEPSNPRLGETLYGIGIISSKRGEYETARGYLQEALNIYKELEQPREIGLCLIELGNVYRVMKDPTTAIVCYERCLTYLDPKENKDSVFGNLYLSFGHARLNRNEIPQAMECYDNGKLHPDSLVLHN